MLPKHNDGCPSPDDYCTCPTCELCGDPAQGKKDVNGISICDECWPDLEADCAAFEKVIK